MEIKDLFLFFGIALAVLAVVVSFVGLKAKNFPSKGVMVGLIVLTVLLVVGTGYYGVELQKEESEEREHGDEHIIGEEASVSPISVPARFS